MPHRGSDAKRLRAYHIADTTGPVKRKLPTWFEVASFAVLLTVLILVAFAFNERAMTWLLLKIGLLHP
jgi:uncharacterized membrane protein YhdT